MSLSPGQLAQRLQGITATDIAAIVGVHPQRSPLQVWLEKTGRATPFAGNKRTKWGALLEGPIRDEYEERHQVRVEVPGTLQHPQHAWWLATPDGLVYRHRQRYPESGLEIKVHGREAVIFGGLEYGAPGTDEVPTHELLQCEWGMGATGLQRWGLVAFLDGAPNEYTIHRDDELLEMMSEAALRFHFDHVLAGVPPPPDGSEAWTEWLASRWKKNTNDFVQLAAGDPRLDLIWALRDSLASEREAEQRALVAIQKIKEEIGETSGFMFRESDRPKLSKVSWRRSRDGERVNWSASYSGMKEAVALVAAAHRMEILQLVDALREGASLEQQARTAELLGGIINAMELIAKADKKMTPVSGPRPFLKPRHWKTRSESDNPHTETEES